MIPNQRVTLEDLEHEWRDLTARYQTLLAMPTLDWVMAEIGVVRCQIEELLDLRLALR